MEAEMEAQGGVVGSLEETGAAVADTLEDGEDAAELRQRMKELGTRWKALREVAGRVRYRLLSAQEEWERLTTRLKELIYWVEGQDEALSGQAPVGGDLPAVKAQALFVKALKKELGEKEAELKDVLDTAHAFLLQQDLRPPAHSAEPEAEGERESRRIGQQIAVETEALDARWKELVAKAGRWEKRMEEALGKMYELDAALANCEAAVSDAETERKSWRHVKDIQLDQLPRQLANTKVPSQSHQARFRWEKRADLQGFKTHLMGLVRSRVDDVNDKSSRLLADNIQLSPASAKILEALNTRYKQVEAALNARLTGLHNALKVHPFLSEIARNNEPACELCRISGPPRSISW